MTPTTMTTSMITTATTMITDVVVVPSLERLLVGCMLLTGTVSVTVTDTKVWGGEVVPTVWGGEVVSTVWGGEVVGGIDSVEKKQQHDMSHRRKHKAQTTTIKVILTRLMRPWCTIRCSHNSYIYSSYPGWECSFSQV